MLARPLPRMWLASLEMRRATFNGSIRYDSLAGEAFARIESLVGLHRGKRFDVLLAGANPILSLMVLLGLSGRDLDVLMWLPDKWDGWDYNALHSPHIRELCEKICHVKATRNQTTEEWIKSFLGSITKKINDATRNSGARVSAISTTGRASVLAYACSTHDHFGFYVRNDSEPVAEAGKLQSIAMREASRIRLHDNFCHTSEPSINSYVFARSVFLTSDISGVLPPIESGEEFMPVIQGRITRIGTALELCKTPLDILVQPIGDLLRLKEIMFS